jgi:hypothetical protein
VPWSLSTAADILQSAAEEAAAANPTVIVGSNLPAATTTNTTTSSNSSNVRVTDWVFTTCLVPEGLPTASAASSGGGLATLEVVCRVLCLQDCLPSAPSAGLVKAIERGNYCID